MFIQRVRRELTLTPDQSAQDLDAHHGQRGENEDHEDLPEIVDRGNERQPEQEEQGPAMAHHDGRERHVQQHLRNNRARDQHEAGRQAG